MTKREQLRLIKKVSKGFRFDLTESQQNMIGIVIFYQYQKKVVPMLYSDRNGFPPLMTYFKQFCGDNWLQDFKFLSSLRILWESVGGEVRFTNQLCGCGSCSRYRSPVRKIHPDNRNLVQLQETLEGILNDTIPVLSEIEDVIESPTIKGKFGKRKKIHGAIHAAKVISSVDDRLDQLQSVQQEKVRTAKKLKNLIHKEVELKVRLI